MSYIKLSPAPVYEEVMELALDSFAYDEESPYGKRYTVTVAYYCQECVEEEGPRIFEYSPQAYDTHHFSGDKEYLFTHREINLVCGHNFPKGSMPEGTGYWKLIETKVLESNLLTEAIPRYKSHISGSETEIKGYCGYSDHDSNSYCDFQISIGAFPERVEAGTELIIPATVTISNSQHKYVFKSSAEGSAPASLTRNAQSRFYDFDYSQINTVDDYNEQLRGNRALPSHVIYYDSYTKGNGSEKADISFHFPDLYRENIEPETYFIALMGGSYNFFNPGDRCDSVVILHAYQWQPPYSDALPGILSSDYTPLDTPAKEASPAEATVDTKADEKAGETGVSIPEALAIAIIGGAAAMAGAGAGAGGGGGDGGDNNSKRRSRYKMCLRKDFGDGIRYDTQPVTVYARIVELTPEGEEIDRPDLTSAIEIFSGGNLAVEDCSMAGNYMGALVSAKSVPGGENPGTGVVSIRFSGEEGSFQNNVTFRIIGKPYISFPEQGRYLTMTLPMLLGDGKVYETPVTLHDFLEKPTSVRLDVAEGIPLSCELEEIQDIENMEAVEEASVQSYILKVKNLSPKPQGPQTVKQTVSFGIIAENDQEKAENSLKAELYPEGLSIREVKFDDQGYVLIDTFDNEATEEWGDVVPTGFVLDFAVPEQDDEGRPTVRVLEPKEYSPVFAGLKGTDERTTHLAERFKYSIQEIPSNLKEYKFAPEEALVEEEGKPYYLTLPISCTYGQKEYTLDLPLRLLGGGPGPLAGWDEAFAHMKKVVSKVGGISPELAKMLRENGKKMSTAELRLVTYRICHDAVTYYTQDAAEYEKIAAELDNMLYYAEWLKWFGDQAFSYLISKYYGNTADALLSPAKDIFAAFLGEVLDYLLNDEPFTLEELETIKNITAGVDNLLVNAFDDAISSENITFKQTCAAVAGFLVWKIAKNIYENRDRDGKVDIYSAITALTADLTAMGVKKIAGNFFDKALDNSAVQKALNKPVSKWMQNIAPNVFKGRWDIDKQGEYLLKIVEFKQSDIIKKYLEESFGAGAVTVVEMGAESAQDWLKSTEDSNASPVDLSAWPRISWVSEFTDENNSKTASLITVDLGLEAIGKFFDHLFGELFGEVPFATAAQSPPVDPIYIPE
ncbi:MAG: hypothetical protein ACOX3R_02620 [Desulfitobacteriia bacterium]